MIYIDIWLIKLCVTLTDDTWIRFIGWYKMNKVKVGTKLVRDTQLHKPFMYKPTNNPTDSPHIGTLGRKPFVCEVGMMSAKFRFSLIIGKNRFAGYGS